MPLASLEDGPLVSLRACEVVSGRHQEPLVVGWRLESSRYTSQAIKLTSSHACHFVRDESTNWFPSASLKIAAVPQCSVFGGIANSTPFAESSS
jgi:hypothetical protein